MTNERFQRLQQFTLVRTPYLMGKVFATDYTNGVVLITVTNPLRRLGQRSRVKYQNVEVVENTAEVK
jgi:hypothetical protein